MATARTILAPASAGEVVVAESYPLAGVDRPKPTTESASDFVLRYGRLPQLGLDKKAPWHYPQWLLWYVQLGDSTALGSGRWSHYIETRQAGHLLDDPIPRIEMACYERAESEGHKAIYGWLDILFHEVGSSPAFSALLDWFLWGLGLADDEPRLTEKVNEQLYREVNLEPLIKMPRDYWGDIYCDHKGKGRWNQSAFYPTPHNVVELMVRMTMEDPAGKGSTLDGRDPRTQTVCDPCVGTGRFPLHASNYSYCLYAMDIDPICVAATKINGALYAPWLTWPFPQNMTDSRVPPPPAPLTSENEKWVKYAHDQRGITDIVEKSLAEKPIRIDEKQQRLF